MARFRLEIPADTLGPVSAAAGRAPGGAAGVHDRRATTAVLEGEVPAARLHELERALPSLTRGEAVLESAFDSLPARCAGAPPRRSRTDANPLDRKEYLLHVNRRV